ncbi:MAG TPA: PQQ-binding-like beta-propeller repeat protein [Candidatus Eremiobacteraceae bacterium]|nr:PQQ-binding-like beta-propeller repeat protein [Candidatus Eremiobacteraceae bacterium]
MPSSAGNAPAHQVVATRAGLVHGPAFGKSTGGADPDFVGEAEDAVTYQINPRHTGAIDGPTIQLPLKVQWTASVGQFSTYPVIANGRVFVGGSFVYALSAATGKMLWGKDESSIGTAYDHGELFSLSGSGLMSAFEARNGRSLWLTQMPGQYSFSSPPATGNGMVYTGGAGSGGTVYAVRETDGTVRWTASVENGDDSSPVVTKTGVFVSYVCPQTYDFAPSTGTLIWHYSGGCEGGGGATAVLYRGLLYTESWASSPPGLALNATNGSPVSTFNSLVTPAFAKGIGYFIQNSNQLVALSTRTGNIKWVQTLSGDAFSVPPLVITNTLSGDLLVCGTQAGNVDVFDAQSGKSLQTLSLGAAPQSGMAFSEGLLVVPAGNNVIGLL